MEFTHAYALIIGVGSHKDKAITNVPITVKDAEAVEKVLKDGNICGYPAGHVTLLKNSTATKDGILAALKELAHTVTQDDTVFIFYCGHGAPGTDGNYYLVSNDASSKGEQVVKGTGVSDRELLEHIKAIPAKRVLMIFNACFSGNIAPTLAIKPAGFKGETLSADLSNALLGTGEARIIITACRENQESYIGPGSLTIFTQALVDGLQGNGVGDSGGYISAYSLYERVYKTVSDAVKAKYTLLQEPEINVVKGVGPFAVALYKGATKLGIFNDNQPLPEHTAVRQVGRKVAQQALINYGSYAQVIGDGIAVAGDGNVVLRDRSLIVDGNVKGDVFTGDKVAGDKVEGDKVVGDKVEGDKVVGNKVVGMKWWQVIIILILVSGLMVAGIYWLFRPSPTKMTGFINVAVANFGEMEARNKVVDSPAGLELADSFYSRLDDQIDAINQEYGLKIQRRGPAEIGRIAGNTADERAKNAASIANSINADVIIYGYLKIAEKQSTLVPEFYIADRLKVDEELKGFHQIDSHLEVSGNISNNPMIIKEMDEQVKEKLIGGPPALSLFIAGLGSLNFYKFDQAQSYFLKAVNLTGGTDAQILKLFYLFLGRTAAEKKDWDGSMGYYSKALGIQPEYARAQLGYADVEFQKAKDNCDSTKKEFDPQGLDNAIRDYKKALTNIDKNDSSHIRTKVKFCLGVAHACQNLAKKAVDWSEAERETQEVINESKGVSSLQALESEAHANLGLIYWSRPNRDIQGAINQYNEAVTLTERADRQAVFYNAQAEIYEALFDYDRADVAWKNAIEVYDVWLERIGQISNQDMSMKYRKMQQDYQAIRTPTSN